MRDSSPNCGITRERGERDRERERDSERDRERGRERERENFPGKSSKAQLGPLKEQKTASIPEES